jgi:hypothetical protein
MSYIKKSYCFTDTPNDLKMRVYHGHITKATAKKQGFCSVSLRVIDTSGKGRGEERYFVAPFENMSKFN